MIEKRQKFRFDYTHGIVYEYDIEEGYYAPVGTVDEKLSEEEWIFEYQN